MVLTIAQKEEIKRKLIACLSPDRHIRKIVVFGSFVSSQVPNDLDVAVFQDSHEGYLALALKYRRMARAVSYQIPMDIIPFKTTGSAGAFMSEVEQGDVIYER